MIDAKALEYKKAYVELSELIKRFPKESIDKIPTDVIDNIETSKDSEYSWDYDDTKMLEEQNIMVETKALFIRLYRKYLMEESENDKWEQYDKISSSYIEEEKLKQFDPSKIFDNKVNKFSAFNVSATSTAVSVTVIEDVEKDDNDKKYLILMEEETWFEKVSQMFKGFIKKIFGKNK